MEGFSCNQLPKYIFIDQIRFSILPLSLSKKNNEETKENPKKKKKKRSRSNRLIDLRIYVCLREIGLWTFEVDTNTYDREFIPNVPFVTVCLYAVGRTILVGFRWGGKVRQFLAFLPLQFAVEFTEWLTYVRTYDVCSEKTNLFSLIRVDWYSFFLSFDAYLSPSYPLTLSPPLFLSLLSSLYSF